MFFCSVRFVLFEEFFVCDLTVTDDLDCLLNNNVSMSNVLARASHDLLLSEKRIIMLAVSFFDSRRFPSSYSSIDSRTFSISVEDYFLISSSSPSSSLYPVLLAASKSLFDRHISFDVPLMRGRSRHVRFRWLDSISYLDGSGSVEFCFSQRVLPFLSGLTKSFISYKISDSVSFRSVYSWRLYEYLLSYVNESVDFSNFVVDVDALRSSLQVPDSYTFNNFRQRVLDSGVRDICMGVPWLVGYKLIKRSRRVIAIDFSVRFLQLPFIASSETDDDFV